MFYILNNRGAEKLIFTRSENGLGDLGSNLELMPLRKARIYFIANFV